MYSKQKLHDDCSLQLHTSHRLLILLGDSQVAARWSACVQIRSNPGNSGFGVHHCLC